MDGHLTSRFPPVLPPKPGQKSGGGGLIPDTASNQDSTAATDILPRRQDATRSEATGRERTQLSEPRVDIVPDAADTGDRWLPLFLEALPKHEISENLANPKLLDALVHSPRTIHPVTLASIQALDATLAENSDIASRLSELENRVAVQRSTLQAQLISTHALERQWRQKQTSMDHALAAFSPASLYQRLAQSVQEQALVGQAIEESFLSAQGDGEPATERETLDWIKSYREAKSLLYLRQERKERWDEGRVGGWR